MNDSQFRTLVRALFYINKMNRHSAVLSTQGIYDRATAEANEFLEVAHPIQPPPLPEPAKKGGK